MRLLILLMLRTSYGTFSKKEIVITKGKIRGIPTHKSQLAGEVCGVLFTYELLEKFTLVMKSGELFIFQFIQYIFFRCI